MFLLVASALAGTLIGYPCQRLNWGWRNVWTTCSLNSFVPHATTTDGVASAPNHYRLSSDTALAPVRSLNANGVYTPVTANAVPLQLCTNALNTGTGNTAGLRNRCRRAIDAYGALVVACGAPAGTAIRGPNMLLTPDWVPNSGHAPHVTNVQGLTHNAQMCLLPSGSYAPTNLNSPSATCPGLLGWFTVVYSACKFTNAPGLNNAPSVPGNLATYFPLGNIASTSAVLNSGPVSPANRAGYFCKTGVGAAGAPDGWNDSTGNGVANTFRTSRCRKALDQFGRTASRCANSAAPYTGPIQAGGYNDPLRFLAVGLTAPNSPNGINSWAPACNA
jgi:hypothetical protein